MSRIANPRVAMSSAAALLLLLFAGPAQARRDLAPSVSADPAMHSVTISGTHHAFKPMLNLIRTDWWLHATIQDGVPGDPELMVAVDLPGWAALDSATDASGAKLAVAVLARGPSTILHGENAERVAVSLPRALVEKATKTGLAITVAGKLRSFPIVVPGTDIHAFLLGYDAAIAAAKTAPPAPPAPPPGPDSVPATTTQPTPEATAPAPTAPPPQSPVVSAPPSDAAPAAVDAPTAGPPATAPMPTPTPAPSSTDVPGTSAMPRAQKDDKTADAPGASAEIPIEKLGIVIEPTSFGAMIASVSSTSPLAKLGVAEGDFISGVDGKSIKGLTGPQMAARIGAPDVRILNCIADGDVTIR